MDKVKWILKKMKISIKAIELKANKMVKVKWLLLIMTAMMVTGKMANKMVRAHRLSLMALSKWLNILMVNLIVKIYGLLLMSTKVLMI